MSDAEWQVVEATLPAPAWKAGKGRRPAQYCRRDVIDAIRYLVKEGIQWRAMPADFCRGLAAGQVRSPALELPVGRR